MKNFSLRGGTGSTGRRLICVSALLGASSIVATPALAANDTTMQLIEMMRDNGTITDAQYQQLRSAAMQDEQPVAGTRQTDAQTQASIAEAVDDRIDARFADYDWMSKIKLKGDIRLRYQYGDNDGRVDDNGDQVDRHRGRVRYRLGIIAKPTDKLEVGAGLASGGSDPRSTNQTFSDDFSSKGINLDYAYAQYQFTDYFKGVAGKFKFGDYVWMPSDLIWDGDINPEGASGHFGFDNALGETFVNGGVWVLNEFGSDSDDPFIYYGQLGQDFESGNAFGTLAAAYYAYANEEEDGTFNPDYSAGTNTDDEFGVLNVNAELGTKFSGGKASLIGEYVLNTATDTDEDTGFAFGGKVGVDKWSFKYLYGDLDANAVPDTFPDSDRFGGATDMKGHEIAGAYALTDIVELGLDYYNTERKSLDIDEQILQADLSVKF